jgi:uncharacterized OB-fold protein
MPEPAILGWFTTDAEPRLIGSRCRECGTYFFPAETAFCRNPGCSSTDLDETPLSNTGTLWSYTVNHYPPPPPSLAQPPYGVAAVELQQEKMIVLGQVDGPLDGLNVGDRMVLVTGDAGEDRTVWKWRKA